MYPLPSWLDKYQMHVVAFIICLFVTAICTTIGVNIGNRLVPPEEDPKRF